MLFFIPSFVVVISSVVFYLENGCCDSAQISHSVRDKRTGLQVLKISQRLPEVPATCFRCLLYAILPFNYSLNDCYANKCRRPRAAWFFRYTVNNVPAGLSFRASFELLSCFFRSSFGVNRFKPTHSIGLFRQHFMLKDHHSMSACNNAAQGENGC